jgi:hypothetical protein
VNRRSFMASVAAISVARPRPFADPFVGREWVPKGRLHASGNPECADAMPWGSLGDVWWVYPKGAGLVYDKGRKFTDLYDGAPMCASCFTWATGIRGSDP